MIVNYPGEHRSLLNVFDWAFFYAHKDIGGCHLVQFIKALRVETSLFKQRDVQPLLCVSATAAPWMLKQ